MVPNSHPLTKGRATTRPFVGFVAKAFLALALIFAILPATLGNDYSLALFTDALTGEVDETDSIAAAKESLDLITRDFDTLDHVLALRFRIRRPPHAHAIAGCRGKDAIRYVVTSETFFFIPYQKFLICVASTHYDAQYHVQIDAVEYTWDEPAITPPIRKSQKR